MLETAHIAYTTTVEMSSSDDVDELYIVLIHARALGPVISANPRNRSPATCSIRGLPTPVSTLKDWKAYTQSNVPWFSCNTRSPFPIFMLA